MSPTVIMIGRLSVRNIVVPGNAELCDSIEKSFIFNIAIIALLLCFLIQRLFYYNMHHLAVKLPD